MNYHIYKPGDPIRDKFKAFLDSKKDKNSSG
jgi:hypothetical protein